MKVNALRQWLSCLRTALVLSSLLCWAGGAAGQPVTLSIRQTASQVTVTWPSGLSLVQPQKATNLATAAWQDFGTATASTNLVDSMSGGQAFYRLRLLPPVIVVQPQAQSVALGGNATFNVTANGTAPLVYQWRKGSANLAGQNAAPLALNSVAAGDAGDYSVVIANPVGSVTSLVAVLTISVPSSAPRGIYMGNFAEQTNGGFATMVRSNGQAVALGHHIPQNEGLLATNFTVAANGSFNVTTEKSGNLTGAFLADRVSGTLASTNGFTTTFSADHKPDAGIHQSNAGYYAGTFSGLLAGSAVFILAADGTVFIFLSAPGLGGGGAFGKIDAANSVSATTTYILPGTTVPALIQVAGTLNPGTHQLTGTYGLGAFSLGTFSMTRVSTP